MRFDPYDYAIQNDPYPAYAWLRANDPVHFNEVENFWVITKHADVAATFRDEVTFSNRMGVSIDRAAWGEQARSTMSFLAMDAPQQTRLRSLVSRGFTPRRVRELEPRIQALTAKFMDPALESGTFDWIADFAGKFPMDVISELMGVPPADRDELRRLADLLVHREDGVRDVPEAGMNAAFELIGYYQDLIKSKRHQPADLDLTTALIHVDAGGDRLQLGEILAFLFLMVVAGNETTTKLLGNAVRHAVDHPAELAKVLADPDGYVSPWVEETLRYDTSTQMLARYVTREVTLRGRAIPQGSQLLVMVGSANRDEDVFERPEVYDLDRKDSAMLSFGLGRHYCLGANLARLEATIALRHLAQRVRAIEVDRDNSRRVHSINVRGFSALPMSVVLR